MTCGLSLNYLNSIKTVWSFFIVSFIGTLSLTTRYPVFKYVSNSLVALVAAKLCIDKKMSHKFYGFQMPLVPLLPCVGIYANFLLACQIELQAWAQYGVYTAIGSLIYFVYGIHQDKDSA